jgi:hypothetical protein
MTGFDSKRQMAQDKEALKLALEALETCEKYELPSDYYCEVRQVYDEDKVNEAITAIKEALAQPKQEPVEEWQGQSNIESLHNACQHRSYCRQLKAQPAQEPVAWAVVGDGKFGEYEIGQVFVDYEATHIYWENRGYELVPVYTTPQQRPWVELTDEDREHIVNNSMTPACVAIATEAKLKEKNFD